MKSEKESSFKILFFLKIPADFFSVAVAPLLSSIKDLQVSLPDNAEPSSVVIRQQDDTDAFSIVRIYPLSVVILSLTVFISTLDTIRGFIAKGVLSASAFVLRRSKIFIDLRSI
ncbi:hypothetical protein KKHLCK_15890 [Candidatus Electrothrix laxa]